MTTQRKPGIFKLTNAYSQSVNEALYSSVPRAVFAALAVSFGTNGGDHLDQTNKILSDEWQILFDQGIVAQKPNKIARSFMTSEVRS